MKTNRNVLLGALAALLVSSLPALRADNAGTPPPPPAGHGKAERRNPGQRLQVIAEKLNLTPDQKAKIEPILKAEAEEIRTLLDDAALERRGRREKMMAINQKYRPQIAAVLTPEQQEKFKAMRKEMRQEFREHREGDKTAKTE